MSTVDSALEIAPLRCQRTDELVSVVIPAHNRLDLLCQTVLSCALQEYPAIEVIVVDDGSDEDVYGALVPVANGLPRGCALKLLRQPRRGASSARNLGLRHAAGAFVQFLDSDDLLHPRKFAAQAERLRANAKLDMVFCLDEQFERVPGDIRVLWNVPDRVDCQDHLDRFLLEDSVWSTGSPLWRRRSLERLPGWIETLDCWQDWHFHTTALAQQIDYECVGTVLQYVRIHDGPRINGLPSLRRERSCLYAGSLIEETLRAFGHLNDRRRSLLVYFFARHLQNVSLASHDDARALIASGIDHMLSVCPSRRIRTAIRVLRHATSTPLFPAALGVALRRMSRHYRVRTLRNLVSASFLPPPPAYVVHLTEAGVRARIPS